MPESLCSVGSGVARNVPVMVRQELFSSGSTFPAWHDLLHTGAQYSAALVVLNILYIQLYPIIYCITALMQYITIKLLTQ